MQLGATAMPGVVAKALVQEQWYDE